MSASHSEFLRTLEERAADCSAEDFYLWPRTPVEDLQGEIARFVGADDLKVNDRRSRPRQVISVLSRLRRAGMLAPDFSVLDICCGDALVLWQIKKAFPDARCYGVDLLKDQIESHVMVQRDGVYLCRGLIQHLFAEAPPDGFDVVMMLNTYRGWPAAGLRTDERTLPDMADGWLRRHGRFAILTARESQIAILQKRDVKLLRLGRGEENSVMICVSEERFPAALVLRHIFVWLRLGLRRRMARFVALFDK